MAFLDLNPIDRRKSGYIFHWELCVSYPGLWVSFFKRLL